MKNRNNSLSTSLIAGGTAGCIESIVVHPLDTLKVRMQLGQANATLSNVTRTLLRNEGVFALYKGLLPVVAGITPKIAIRFATFEKCNKALEKTEVFNVQSRLFLAGMGAGTTEAIAVVTPMEVVKIRLQAQKHPLSASSIGIGSLTPKYRNAGHALVTIFREEGIRSLWKGVLLTSFRQATNQGVNFLVFHEIKKHILRNSDKTELASHQSLVVGGMAGLMGPIANAPVDTIKTRIQQEKNSHKIAEPALERFKRTTREIVRESGLKGLYKGIVPRLLRVVPGQAIVFFVYEKVSHILEPTL